MVSGDVFGPFRLLDFAAKKFEKLMVWLDGTISCRVSASLPKYMGIGNISTYDVGYFASVEGLNF